MAEETKPLEKKVLVEDPIMNDGPTKEVTGLINYKEDTDMEHDNGDKEEEKEDKKEEVQIGHPDWTYFDRSVYHEPDYKEVSPPCKELTPSDSALLIAKSGGSVPIIGYESDLKGDHYTPCPGVPGSNEIDTELNVWVLNHLPQTTTFVVPEEVKKEGKVAVDTFIEKKREAINNALKSAMLDQRLNEVKKEREAKSQKSMTETILDKKEKIYISKTPDEHRESVKSQVQTISFQGPPKKRIAKPGQSNY